MTLDIFVVLILYTTAEDLKSNSEHVLLEYWIHTQSHFQ